MPMLENRLFTCDEAFLAPVFHLCTDALFPADATSAAQEALPPENGAAAQVDDAVSDCPASDVGVGPDPAAYAVTAQSVLQSNVFGQAASVLAWAAYRQADGMAG